MPRIFQRCQVAWLQLRLGLNARFGRRLVVDSRSNVVVSLTSHGDRIRTAHLTIESIGRGTVRPGRLILWIGVGDAASVTRVLNRLRARGLEIVLARDVGPHTKYFPYLTTADSLHLPLVTADDDILYPRFWLSELVDAHTETAMIVRCHRAHRVGVSADSITPYLEWTPCDDTEPSHANFLTGVSGVIYPPSAQQVLRGAGDGFRTISPRADDVWINAKLIEAGIRVQQIRSTGPRFPVVRRAQRSALWRTNNHGHGDNDLYIARAYTDLVRGRVVADRDEKITANPA